MFLQKTFLDVSIKPPKKHALEHRNVSSFPLCPQHFLTLLLQVLAAISTLETLGSNKQANKAPGYNILQQHKYIEVRIMPEKDSPQLLTRVLLSVSISFSLNNCQF